MDKPKTCSVCSANQSAYKCPKCRALYCSKVCCATHKDICIIINDANSMLPPLQSHQNTQNTTLVTGNSDNNTIVSVGDFLEGKSDDLLDDQVCDFKRSFDTVSTSETFIGVRDIGGTFSDEKEYCIDSKRPRVAPVDGIHIVDKISGNNLKSDTITSVNTSDFDEVGLVSKETYARLSSCTWLTDILRSKRLQEQIRAIDSLDQSSLRSDRLKQVRENNPEFDEFVRSLLGEMKRKP